MDEVGLLHLALGLDALVVQVGVEEDGSKGEQKHGVGAVKLLRNLGVAPTELRGECLRSAAHNFCMAIH